ncbi:MAG: tetratricopeptide repeat protein, partial [Planctomycetota bacterium]
VDCHGPMLVDCFHGGRTLDREDAEDRVKACCGEEADFREDMLRPVTHRHWVTRLIQNLLQTYTTAGQYSDVAAMLEFELVLWPDQLHLERDLGLVLARLGQTAAATTWINRYLKQRPDDPQRGDLEELLGVLS